MNNKWLNLTMLLILTAVLTMLIVAGCQQKTPASGDSGATTDPVTLQTQPTTEAAATETTVATEAPTAATEPTDSTEPTGVREELILEKYLSYYQQNNDLVGWIRLPGTKIDYPVLQTSTDTMNYYIDKDFNKQSSTAGSIYARELCDVFKPSDNIVLYGHNMKNNTMFGILDKYTKESYWKDNQYIYFDTLYEEHTYQIFAVFAISADAGNYPYHRFNDAANEEEFNTFIRIVTNSPEADPAITKTIRYYYNTGITPQYGDKLITLSTCEYSMGDNGRLVVVAYRVA